LNRLSRATTPDAALPATPAPRPMTRADVSAFAALFTQVFRPGKAVDPALPRYLEQLLFENPAFDPALPALVQENDEGRIVAAMGYVQIPMVACGRELTARLMTAFMTSPEAPKGSAGRIAALTRAKRQDFTFTTTAASLSAEAARAGGGLVLPLQSLDFFRTFRPAAQVINLVLGRRAATLLTPLHRAVDGVIRTLKKTLAARSVDGVGVHPIDRARVIEAAQGFVSHFAVHPRWTADVMGWQLDMAAQQTSLGTFTTVGIGSSEDTLVGMALYYSQPGGIAHLLNLMALPGQERCVLRALLAHLDAQGHAAVRGEAQPFLMASLFVEPGVSYRFRGNFCVLTRHPDIAQAVLKGDFYAGGLIGESWCRLIADF